MDIEYDEHKTIDCRRGYRIIAGEKGGWMVMEDSWGNPDRIPLTAAFSTYVEMLDWLAKCHKATFSARPSEPA